MYRVKLKDGNEYSAIKSFELLSDDKRFYVFHFEGDKWIALKRKSILSIEKYK